ncbi:A-kinase anchor protein 14-like [Babylonia areolata]|uniref:A-kinase anchor protein 14-like n=1 Tax=Babylonia areolata TaxID=304850 RepID=UPI003FD30845
MTEPSDTQAEQAKELVDNVISNAKDMVDDVIASAFRRLETRMSEREKTCESLKADLVSKENTFISRDEDYDIQDIGWMTIEEFSVERAEEKINEYIKTWEYDNSWLYCVDFLGEDTHPYDKRYRFRVRWSIPTRRKPVPRATASVYFTFVISTIKPKNYPVDVFYVFETNRLVHKPGQSRFREKWLKDIIETKVSMMAAVRF